MTRYFYERLADDVRTVMAEARMQKDARGLLVHFDVKRMRLDSCLEGAVQLDRELLRPANDVRDFTGIKFRVDHRVPENALLIKVDGVTHAVVFVHEPKVSV